jgi:transcriptional regulator with XRE-family HTH domain
MKPNKAEKTPKQAKQPTATDSKQFINEKCLIFGANMRAARKERGFTAEGLGKFLGISTAYVGLIERGERCPSLEIFLKICEFFGESCDAMLVPKAKAKVSEKKSTAKGDNSKDQEARKRKMITSMIGTFNADELDYISSMVKNLKNFSMTKQPELDMDSK